MASEYSESKRVDEILLSYAADLNNIGKYLGATYDNATERARTAILAELAKAREGQKLQCKSALPKTFKYLEKFDVSEWSQFIAAYEDQLEKLQSHQPTEQN